MAVFEIKFRGKRVDNGQWIFGDLLHLEENFQKINKILDWSSEREPYNHTVIKKSVGQMWKPSEGLIVFTGDLLKAECSPSGSNIKKERLCKIVFEPKGMNVVVWHKGEWWAYGSMNFTTAKVIGNIIDNPELLECRTA